MLIGFDFDSVIVDTGLTMCGILTEELKRQVTPEEIRHYTIEHNFPIEVDSKLAGKIISKTLEAQETLQCPPIDGALDFIRWYAKSHPINIITNRRDIEPVKLYLQHSLDYNTYKKINVYGSHDKGQLCKNLGITHFVDDHIRNIIDLANHGVVPIMILRNWNRWIFTGRENITQLIRFISSWEDMYGIVSCERENVI